jgi:hypothetical protein
MSGAKARREEKETKYEKAKLLADLWRCWIGACVCGNSKCGWFVLLRRLWGGNLLPRYGRLAENQRHAG